MPHKKYWWLSQCNISVINKSKLSSTHFVSNIRHQHRCKTAVKILLRNWIGTVQCWYFFVFTRKIMIINQLIRTKWWMMKTRRHRDNLKISIQNFEVLIVLIVTNLYWSDQTLLIFFLGGLTQVNSPPVGKQGNVDNADIEPLTACPMISPDSLLYYIKLRMKCIKSPKALYFIFYDDFIIFRLIPMKKNYDF